MKEDRSAEQMDEGGVKNEKEEALLEVLKVGPTGAYKVNKKGP